ncbi:Cdc6/Cdc18 family protein [Halobellus rarus]|uniref:Cdc6/Cdc18 family protein n=1 Tax=Halobellus rarus TaxID=1126237 RepID=A0ABD6CT72_9EURY
MIQNARVLREEWVPEELHHREGHLQNLSAHLNPVARDLVSSTVMITGPSGTGKTTIAKYIVRQLEQEVLGIRWGYVNAISETSMSSIVYSLLRDAGRANDLRAKGTPRGVLFDRLRDLDDHFIAIVDEIDVLDDEKTIQALWEIPNVTLVLICVDEDDFFADLDSTVASRIRGAAKVALERYHHEELVEILWSRIDTGLASGVVDEETVEYIADVAAGDARHAITLLRRAVREAVGKGDERLTVQHVVPIREDAREEIHERHVDTLGTHQRHLYEIIKEAGEIGASTLHARYEDRVQDPRVKSTRRKYLQSLEHYELIESSGSGRGRAYRFSEP